MLKQNKTTKVGVRIALAVVMVGGNACTKLSGLTSQVAGTSSTALTTNSGSVSMKVVDTSSGSTIFDDTTTSKTFSLTAGRSYSIQLGSSTLPTGSSVKATFLNTSIPNATPQIVAVTAGVSNFMPATAGDYSMKVTAQSSAGTQILTKTYSATVTCQSPTFTANSLNSNGISISGSDDLYTYSAVGAIASANGQGPYLCAYDLTGVGIVDTTFTDCSIPLVKQYSPYVQSRNVGVVIKDACNTSYSIAKTINLPASTPTGPGNTFITATISGESGRAATDVRVKGVQYSAINVSGYTPVSPGYGGTDFSIQSYLSYNQASSVQFGMKIEVTGLGGTFDLRNNVNGNVDASAATIAKVTYITDQAGDTNPSVTLTSTSCTTTGLHAQVQNPVGTPCANSGTTGSNNVATVEVWGEYSCSSTSSGGGTVTITGTFDGYQHLVDNCQGGGGGGGGGITPIHL